ncbi:MAG: XRE family transcriptional regulator [Deltaproteobacteria bacterium]|nr:XRE family transcriptional regulator [Deltaproteobacteria bacterium]
MNQSELDIGSKIRSYRKRKGLSLSRLSELTGVAASNLSSIELNKTSPTLNTLAKIADAFDVRIGELLNGILYRRAVVCEPSDSRKSRKLGKGVIEYLLTADAVLNRLEVKLLNFSMGSAPLLVPLENTDRFIFVTKGLFRLVNQDEKIELIEGQGVYLAPDAEAQLENIGKSPAKALLIHTTG